MTSLFKRRTVAGGGPAPLFYNEEQYASMVCAGILALTSLVTLVYITVTGIMDLNLDCLPRRISIWFTFLSILELTFSILTGATLAISSYRKWYSDDEMMRLLRGGTLAFILEVAISAGVNVATYEAVVCSRPPHCSVGVFEIFTYTLHVVVNFAVLLTLLTFLVRMRRSVSEQERLLLKYL